MQEGIMSLMQMPRTTVALQLLKEANLPFIVVLTHQKCFIRLLKVC